MKEMDKKELYHFEGGLKQFAEDINKVTAITESVSFNVREDDVEVDIAFMYNHTYTERNTFFCK